jgi:hypothetical protein
MRAVTKTWYTDNVAKLRDDQWELILDGARTYIDNDEDYDEDLDSAGDTSGVASIVEFE